MGNQREPGQLPRDETLRERVVANLAGFAARTSEAKPGRAAAVALAIADAGHGAEVGGLPRHAQWSDAAAVLLTRRSSRLRNHAGQWALPGGRLDAGERHEHAALRELSEEIGLALSPSAVLGRLDDFATRSGFVITPIVVWAGAAVELRRNPAEVASIHRIPVTELMRADAPMLEHEHDPEVPVLRMPIGDSWIAAPTAALLYQFREVCVYGRHTRVAHFEQPRFAWR